MFKTPSNRGAIRAFLCFTKLPCHRVYLGGHMVTYATNFRGQSPDGFGRVTNLLVHFKHILCNFAQNLKFCLRLWRIFIDSNNIGIQRHRSIFTRTLFENQFTQFNLWGWGPIDSGCPSFRLSVIDSFPGCIFVTDDHRDLKIGSYERSQPVHVPFDNFGHRKWPNWAKISKTSGFLKPELFQAVSL